MIASGRKQIMLSPAALEAIAKTRGEYQKQGKDFGPLGERYGMGIASETLVDGPASPSGGRTGMYVESMRPGDGNPTDLNNRMARMERDDIRNEQATGKSGVFGTKDDVLRRNKMLAPAPRRLPTTDEMTDQANYELVQFDYSTLAKAFQTAEESRRTRVQTEEDALEARAAKSSARLADLDKGLVDKRVAEQARVAKEERNKVLLTGLRIAMENRKRKWAAEDQATATRKKREEDKAASKRPALLATANNMLDSIYARQRRAPVVSPLSTHGSSLAEANRKLEEIYAKQRAARSKK